MQADIEEPASVGEQGVRRAPNALPLSFVLEGKSPYLTTIVQAIMALWMTGLAFEGGGMLHRFSVSVESFEAKLLEYLLYLGVGTGGATLCFFALTLNLRNTKQDNWKCQSVKSILALIGIDSIAAYHTQDVLRHIIFTAMSGASKAEWICLVARGFLLLSGMSCVFIFNSLFFRKFGCCISCMDQGAGFQTLMERNLTWSLMRNRASCQGMQSGDSLESEYSNAGSSNGQDSPAFPTDAHAMVSISEVQHITRVDTGTSSRNGLNSSVTQGQSPRRVLGRGGNVVAHPVWSFNARTSSREIETRNGEDPLLQDDSPRALLEEMPSLKVDMSKTMKKRLLAGDENIMSLFLLSQTSIKKLWKEVKEEQGHFRYPVWVRSTFLISLVTLIYVCIKKIGLVVSLVERYKKQHFRIRDNMEKLDEFLIAAGWLHGVDGVARSTTIRLCLVLDKVIRSLEWTVFIGYPIGTWFGICSVITILVQFKRVSVEVSEEVAQRTFQAEDSEQSNSPWAAFHRQYPVVGAYVFMAIVSSTAVLQALIASAVISLLLGLLRNIGELWFVLRYVGPFLLASLAILLFDYFAMKFLERHLLYENGKEIEHPRQFNLCMMVLSAVHLLVGILYAVWRVVYLMITTLFFLSRLDVSLFTFWKCLDNGHNAFMSMLGLNLLVQEGRDVSED